MANGLDGEPPRTSKVKQASLSVAKPDHPQGYPCHLGLELGFIASHS